MSPVTGFLLWFDTSLILKQEMACDRIYFLISVDYIYNISHMDKKFISDSMFDSTAFCQLYFV